MWDTACLPGQVKWTMNIPLLVQLVTGGVTKTVLSLFCHWSDGCCFVSLTFFIVCPVNKVRVRWAERSKTKLNSNLSTAWCVWASLCTCTTSHHVPWSYCDSLIMERCRPKLPCVRSRNEMCGVVRRRRLIRSLRGHEQEHRDLRGGLFLSFHLLIYNLRSSLQQRYISLRVSFEVLQ